MASGKINYEYALDSQGARLDATNRRMFIIILVLVSALLITNVAWTWYALQFGSEETTMIEAEQDGDLNIIGGGDVNYGSEGSSNQN